MNRTLALVIVAGLVNLMPSAAQALLFGDVNGDGLVNVVDVQLMGKVSLGLPLGPVLDADGDGVPDLYAENADTAACGANTLQTGLECLVDEEWLTMGSARPLTMAMHPVRPWVFAFRIAVKKLVETTAEEAPVETAKAMRTVTTESVSAFPNANSRIAEAMDVGVAVEHAELDSSGMKRSVPANSMKMGVGARVVAKAVAVAADWTAVFGMKRVPPIGGTAFKNKNN